MNRSTPMKRTQMTRKAPMARSTAAVVKKPAAEPKVRMRRCALPGCRERFTPRSMTHRACCPDHAQELVAVEKARAVRKERQAGLAALKGRADYIKELQTKLNAYVRERDAHLTCISCGRWHDGQWHAGHYLSVGARPGLRFIEANLAKQCMPCNVHLSGNQVNFRLGLVARIGLAAVEALESDDKPRKHSIEELKAMKAHYTAKLKELKASRVQLSS